jgi:hypothetical protein
MDRQDNSIFLYWLMNRLRYKHNYSVNDPVIVELSTIMKSMQNQELIDIQDSDLDKIISKYYIDFFLDKTEDFNVGYSENERSVFRTNIRSIVSDIINKDIPKNYIS